MQVTVNVHGGVVVTCAKMTPLIGVTVGVLETHLGVEAAPKES